MSYFLNLNLHNTSFHMFLMSPEKWLQLTIIECLLVLIYWHQLHLILLIINSLEQQ